MTLIRPENKDQILKYEIDGKVTVSGKVTFDVTIDNEMFMKMSPTAQKAVLKHMGRVHNDGN